MWKRSKESFLRSCMSSLWKWKIIRFRQRLNNFSNYQCKHLLGYKSQWYIIITTTFTSSGGMSPIFHLRSWDGRRWQLFLCQGTAVFFQQDCSDGGSSDWIKTWDNKLNHQHISYIIQLHITAIPPSLNQCCYSLTASACLWCWSVVVIMIICCGIFSKFSCFFFFCFFFITPTGLISSSQTHKLLIT